MRAAGFRDVGRDIVRKDRDGRKAGRSVDTAGAIARALERAYRLGFEDAQRGTPVRMVLPPDAPMAWDLIPRRPRSAFFGICLRTLSFGSRPEASARLVPATTERRGTLGWRLVVVDTPEERDSVDAERTIRILVRHELLEAAGDGSGHLVLSARGRATWWMAVEARGTFPEL